MNKNVINRAALFGQEIISDSNSMYRAHLDAAKFKIANSDPTEDVPMQQEVTETLKGILEAPNQINTVFFSVPNRQYLHAAIRRKVFEASNGLYNISPQSDTELMNIMRDIYKEFGMYYSDPVKARAHVKSLDDIVIDKASVLIIREISWHFQYLVDVQQGWQEPPKPSWTSKTGTKGGNDGIIPREKQF